MKVFFLFWPRESKISVINFLKFWISLVNQINKENLHHMLEIFLGKKRINYEGNDAVHNGRSIILLYPWNTFDPLRFTHILMAPKTLKIEWKTNFLQFSERNERMMHWKKKSNHADLTSCRLNNKSKSLLIFWQVFFSRRNKKN